MSSLASAIERYLLRLLERAQAVEIQRQAVAAIFGCAPSQINYVLETRFTPERGFLVESRRGAAGFVRIVRLELPPGLDELLAGCVGESVTQEGALHLVERLAAGGWVTPREAAMMAAALDRRSLALPLPERDRLRARLLRAMITSLRRPDQAPPGGRGSEG